MIIIERIKHHYLFIILTIVYLISRLIYLNSDYNIFDPSEVYALNPSNDLNHFSIYLILVQIISQFIPRIFNLFPQRLISILSIYLTGYILYYYCHYKRISNKLIILIIFWFSPLVYYYSRVGQSISFGMLLLVSSLFLYPIYKNRILALSLFALAVLACPCLVIFLFSLYLMFQDHQITIIEQLFYFFLPATILSIINPYYALLLITPIFIIAIYHLIPKPYLITPIIIVCLLPFLIKAYHSTIHTSLKQLNYQLEKIQHIYYQYPVYTTFNQDALSLFFQKPIRWLESDLTQGGILITDDIDSLNLNNKIKEQAYLIYQSRIASQSPQYIISNNLSYFPAKYDNNIYRIYLIYSQDDLTKMPFD